MLDIIKGVQTLADLFRERVKRTPQHLAYHFFDKNNENWQSFSWAEMAQQVARWQIALVQENLLPGDRVAVMLRNSPTWVIFDQAALGLGLVTVPLYTDDRPDNIAYILAETEAKLLLLDGILPWKRLYQVREGFSGVTRIITMQQIQEPTLTDGRLITVNNWLNREISETLRLPKEAPENLASIVYTSGTTGRPKGVMLSHRNILSNAMAAADCWDFRLDDCFLSLLPLSHMLERTAGYYLPMISGSTVVYARSIQQFGSDLMTWHPTVLISVPRIYEQIYSKIQSQLETKPLRKKLFTLAVEIGWRRFEYQQGRAPWHPSLLGWPLLQRFVAAPLLTKLGGRIRLSISGGAALPFAVAKVFLAMGVNLVQGYGLTETSPIISVNRLTPNLPQSIGQVLPNVEVKLGEGAELLTRSPCVMLGYWKNPEATQGVIDEEGWLHTGDQVHLNETGHLFITGRLKEIIVMGNGEKISPVDMETKIITDPLFDQVMIVGEGRPFLAALVVLNANQWSKLATRLKVEPTTEALKTKGVQKAILERLGSHLKDFPGYAQVRRLSLLLEPWSIENGLLTPTLKMKRPRIIEKYASHIEEMYQGF